MALTNDELIRRFFQAYGQRDLEAVRQVMDEKVKWTFPGTHPLAGVKLGIAEVVAFFDAMGTIMGESKVQNQTLIIGTNDEYVIECQHISTQRDDGMNLDQDMCVLWRFEGERIIEGRHFPADPAALDEFFNWVARNNSS
jgi:ketosteroid isomerase-like protein